MTPYAYRWRCPRCGWRYVSPIAVLGVTCPHHKGGGVAMRADDETTDEEGGE